MADEAVIRIVLQDAGKGGSGGGAPPGGGGGTGGGGGPQFVGPLAPPGRADVMDLGAKIALESAKQDIAAMSRVDDLGAKIALEAAKQDMAAAEKAAKAEIERDNKEREIHEFLARKHLETVQMEQKAIADRDALEKEQLRKEAEQAMARAHSEEEYQRKFAEQQRKDYMASLPEVEAVFDPHEEAVKKYDRELRKQQVDDAYKKLTGDEDGEGDSSFDKVLGAVGKMRGTLGGVLGPMVGAALDVVSAVSDMDKGFKKKRVPEALEALPADTLEAVPADVLEAKPANSPDVPLDAIPVANVTETAGDAAKAVGGAGKAFGALGEVAPVAASVAAIVMAAKALQDAVTAAVIGGARAAIGAVSGIANFAASPNADPSAPIADFGKAISSAGDKVSSVVPVLGLLYTVVGDTTTAFASLMQNIDKTAQRYGQYSPEIAQAQAIAEIRHTLGDMRRSQEISAQMSEYLAAQSDLQQNIEDIKVKMLAQILPVVTRILEVINAVMPSAEGIETAVSALSVPLNMLAMYLSEVVGLVRDQRQPDPKDPTSALEGWQMRWGQSVGGTVPDR